MCKKVVLLGGGHGLSNIVKGFKDEDVDLTIIVASTDDGGHTGILRNEFNVVAVGDLRMVLNELIDDNSSLKEIFNYRFNLLHGANKVSLGNLIIVSLLEKYKNPDKVIEYFKEKEKIKSNVFLASNTPLTLCAKCEDGEIVKKEYIIGECNKKIDCLFSERPANCNSLMLEKINDADIIVLCPGSLYTSVGAVVCIEQIKEAICKSNAKLIYVCNIMQQNGETIGYSVNDHERALVKLIGKKIDKVIVNNGNIGENVLKKYKEENSDIVKCDVIESNYEFCDLVEINDDKVRHNSELTKKIILKQ